MSKQSKRERQRLNREARREYEESLAKRRRAFRTVRALILVAVPVVAIGAFLSLSGDDKKTKNPALAAGCRVVKKAPPPKDVTFEQADLTIDPAKTYDATIETSCGSFTIRLADDEAPVTVNSFVFLANQGFYDNLTFHRVVKDFVAQGGDPQNNGTGGPGYVLPDEPPAEGYQQGSVAMANAGPGTSGSGFFIVTTEQGAANLGGPPYLYSIVGQVTDGFETIKRINKLGSTEADPALQQPKAIIVVDKITISEALA